MTARAISLSTPAATPPLLPGVLALLQTLWSVAHGLQQTSKRMRRDIGITGPQRLVLRVVGLVPGLAPKDLAAVLHVHPSTLTGVLRRLEGRRLLVREPDPRDRRRVRLRLGPAGRHANAQHPGTVEAAAIKALRACGATDVAATIRVLQRLSLELAPPPAAATVRPSRGRHARVPA